LLGRMKADNFPFQQVKAISGSGQQHGGVYWRMGASETLASLVPEKTLAEQLKESLTVDNGPIWMDSSTGAQCAALEVALGGAQAVADLTGSRAYERFTGNQIAKIASQQPEVYAATERISLVSSMMCSLLLGKYAGVDHSDGGGTNLLNLRTKEWSKAAVDATAPYLEEKLGVPVAPHAVLGTVSPYMTQRYGFDGSCVAIAWSGDNPNSVAGLGLKEGDIAVSMGTSDTLFGITSSPQPATEGHIFANPVDTYNSYMAMLCYKNGSLNRERIRDAICPSGSWEDFNAMLAKAPPGNGGCVGIYIAEPEITPPLPRGDLRFNADGSVVKSFEPEVEARAVLEGMALSMKLHSASIGIHSPSRIIATGGASANLAVLQVLSDVFGLDVFTADSTDSASLGAAIRAIQGWEIAQKGEFVPFQDVFAGKLTLSNQPKAEQQVYTDLLQKYAKAEALALSQNHK